jgi:hypothetical protein
VRWRAGGVADVGRTRTSFFSSDTAHTPPRPPRRYDAPTTLHPPSNANLFAPMLSLISYNPPPLPSPRRRTPLTKINSFFCIHPFPQAPNDTPIHNGNGFRWPDDVGCRGCAAPRQQRPPRRRHRPPRSPRFPAASQCRYHHHQRIIVSSSHLPAAPPGDGLPGKVARTPGGCQIGYMDHVGCHPIGVVDHTPY